MTPQRSPRLPGSSSAPEPFADHDENESTL